MFCTCCIGSSLRFLKYSNRFCNQNANFKQQQGSSVLSYYTVLMMFKSGMLITKRFKNFVIL